MIHLKYLILETPIPFFLLFNWNSSFTFNEHSVTCIFRYYQEQTFLVLLKGYGENLKL